MKALLTLLLAAPLCAAGPAPAKPDMRRAPELGAPKPYAAPPRARWTLPNGVALVYVESPRAPLLTLRLAVKGGTALGGERDAGLVEALAELLSEGTQARGALEVAEAAEAAGGSVGAYATDDHTVVWAEGLAEKADELLGLLKETALTPAFPESEVALRKENMLSELKLRRSEPAWLAGAALGRVLYGEHPYGVPGPTEASIARIERGALQRLHGKLFQPQNAVLVAVGPLPAADFRAKADAAFAGWPARPELPSPPPSAPAARTAPALSFVERPGLEQSVVSVGLPAPKEDVLGYEALLVANMVFGGSYGSRLNNDLREDKGWTYGVYSSVERRLAVGAFSVSGQFRADATRKALDGIRSHLARLRAGPPAPDELERAKANLVTAMLLSFETQGGVADRVLHDALFGLPDDHVDRVVGRIQAVTAAESLEAARRWLDDGNVSVAVVGDAAVLKSLEGYAPVTVVGPDGLPVKK
ncbi:insulinase family protein [bacterium]|nr:MAG: insulinase family protein [bacterium]